jgi:hypothetical protein
LLEKDQLENYDGSFFSSLREHAAMATAVTIAAHYITDSLDCKFFLAGVKITESSVDLQFTADHSGLPAD